MIFGVCPRSRSRPSRGGVSWLFLGMIFWRGRRWHPWGCLVLGMGRRPFLAFVLVVRRSVVLFDYDEIDMNIAADADCILLHYFCLCLWLLFPWPMTLPTPIHQRDHDDNIAD